MRARYVEILQDATKIEPSGSTSSPTSTRGSTRSATCARGPSRRSSERHLREEFGTTWFARREAGSLLRELWNEGQRMDGDEILQEVVGVELDLAAVAERIEEPSTRVSASRIVIAGAAGRDSTTSTSPSAIGTTSRWSRSPPPRSRTSRGASTRPSSRASATRTGSRSCRGGARRPRRPRADRRGGLRLFRRDARARHARGLAPLAAGADYRLLGPRATELASSKQVVAVCAVRTGSGKSQTTRHVARLLRDDGKRSPSSATPCRTATSRSRSCSGSSATRTSTRPSARSRSARSTSRTSPRATWSSRASTTRRS